MLLCAFARELVKKPSGVQGELVHFSERLKEQPTPLNWLDGYMSGVNKLSHFLMHFRLGDQD